MTNTIPNVPHELKPCPFCGGEADPKGWMSSDGAQGPACDSCGATANSADEWNARASSPANHVEDVRAMVAAPSSAGVDGLEVETYLHTMHMELGQTEQFCSKWKGDPFGVSGVDYSSTYSVTSEPLCRLSDAQAIIDGLRGEVDKLMTTFVRVADHLHIDCEKAKSAPGKPSDVFIAAIDQQAQRIGELEGLLLRVQVSLSLDDTEWGYSGAEKYKLLADIRAALSAGKEGE